MTTSTPTRRGTRQIDRALNHFLATREGARRFHKAEIGEGVDPDYSFGDWLGKVRASDDAGIRKTYGAALGERWQDDLASSGVRVKAALAESSGVTGGYTVPPDLRDDIMANVAERAIFRPRAKVVPIRSASLLLPLPDASVGAAGLAPFFGGVQLYWLTEGYALTESEPKWKQIELATALMGGYAIASEQIMQDGLALEAWLRELFATSIAWYEDYFCINGVGVGLLGVVNAPGALAITRNTTVTIKTADVQSMFGKLYSIEQAGYRRGTDPQDEPAGSPIWILSRSCAAALVNVTNWQPNDSTALYGMGTIVTSKQPVVGTIGDIILMDPRLYVIGDREELTIEMSRFDPTPYSKFQSSWKFTERVAGCPWLQSSITLPDASGTTCSPFVLLSTL